MQEASTATFNGIGLEGPSSVLDVCRHFQKHPGDPRLWLESWRQMKNLAEGDRVIHELRTLTDALFYGATHDQLNLPSLASFEVICRRIQLITEAYSNPAAPNWSGARFFSGVSRIDDFCAPELKQFVAKKSKEVAEMESAKNKGNGSTGGAGGGASSGGGGPRAAGKVRTLKEGANASGGTG